MIGTNESFERGVAAVNSGDIAEGVYWFRQAVADNPRNAEALAYLGQTLIISGQRYQGLEQLHRAGRLLVKNARKSKNVSDVLALAEQLQSCNDFAGSIELGQQALRIRHDDARIFQLLALAFSRLNLNDLAWVAIKQALKQLPEHPRLNILAARLEARKGRKHEAEKRLHSIIEKGQLTLADQSDAHRELALILDSMGQFEAVFAHLTIAGECSAALPEFKSHDPAYVPALLEHYQRRFKRRYFEQNTVSKPHSKRSDPFFISGFFRSGTTLIQEVLATRPDVFVADEVDFIAMVRAELERMRGSSGLLPEQLAGLDSSVLNRLREFYWQRVEAYYGHPIEQPVFIEKTTLSIIDLGLINCLFPNARLIFAVRDPRDVCLSSFMQAMAASPVTVQLTTWPGVARFYSQVMEWWLHVREQTTLVWKEINYRDVVHEFEPTVSELFDFIGLKWHARAAQFHRQSAQKFIASPSYHQVSLPLYDSSIARWRNYPEVMKEVNQILQPYIDRWGEQVR